HNGGRGLGSGTVSAAAMPQPAAASHKNAINSRMVCDFGRNYGIYTGGPLKPKRPLRRNSITKPLRRPTRQLT
ncbi:MAG: hypothetical protein WCC81_25140, partial [Pseudolabrys sp.]